MAEQTPGQVESSKGPTGLLSVLCSGTGSKGTQYSVNISAIKYSMPRCI